jgi:hypothetical protein
MAWPKHLLNEYHPTPLCLFTQRGRGVAFGDHQRAGRQGILGNPLESVFAAPILGCGIFLNAGKEIFNSGKLQNLTLCRTLRPLIAAISGTRARVEPYPGAHFADGLDRRFRHLGKTGGIAFGTRQQGCNAFPAAGGLRGLGRGFSAQRRDFGVDPSGPVLAEYFGEMLTHSGMLQEFFLPGVWGMIFFRS